MSGESEKTCNILGMKAMQGDIRNRRMKFLKDSFTTQFPSSDKSRVSAYPVAVITILFFGCFLYVLNPVWAIVTVIILLQIATGIMLSFNHERFGISNRKKAWGVVGLLP